ncbi:hypothetical protein BASA81_016362 [Batrachochytrium salamandrivorans]|nr:hypothetical protein BASA81_016362 [Batrachochytrium salamandrivorans]
MPSSVAAASKLPWTSRKIAEMWNHEPQHVKDSYSEKYALARKQYEKDYAKYLSSLSVTDHLVLSKERTLRKSLGLKVTKLPENVGRPKKGCTAGLHFIRETLKLPEGSINDLVGGVVGSSLTARVPALWKVWHRMDADAKRPYISAAEKDREVYKRKMEQYTSDHLKTVNAMKSSIVSLGASFKAKLPSAKLASKRLAAKKLASKRLAAAKLASKKLAAKKLAAKRLAAKRLAAAKLASKKLAVKKLAAEKLASKRLAAKTLAAKRLAAAKLASKKLTGKKTATKKTATKKLVSKKPVGVKPSTSKLSAKKAPAKKVVLSKKPASSKKAVSGKTSTAKKATKASVSRK